MKNRPRPRISLEPRCWFCWQTIGDFVFSMEFDTPVHLTCVHTALACGNPEARIMAREFDMELDIEPNTNTPMDFQQPAEAMNRLGTPVSEEEDRPLECDPDDYPLF